MVSFALLTVSEVGVPPVVGGIISCDFLYGGGADWMGDGLEFLSFAVDSMCVLPPCAVSPFLIGG